MPAALVKSIAEETGISLAEAEKRWAKAKEITLEETDLKESDGEDYWKYVTGVFKKSMGHKEDQVLEKATAYFQFLSPAEKVAPSQDNMKWCLDRKVNYVDAMFRKDTGWISFLWGNAGSESSGYADGYGISNILAKGGQGTEDALIGAAETLARGRIKRKYGPPGNKKIDMIWRGNVVRLDWHRGRKTWYLAGWPGLKHEPEDVEEETPVLEDAKIDREADKAASSPTNKEPEPTDAQKESGNYKKGHVRVMGLDIAIENPKGSERSGTDRNGKTWTSKLNHHYGYFKRSEGKDGDQVDVFLGPDPEGADKVFVVNQVNPETGAFDEHKVLMGFKSDKEAEAAYLSNYEKGWKGLGSMVTLSVENFKHWLKEGDTKKPAEKDQILESAIQDWRQVILSAATFDDLQAVFVKVFPDVEEPEAKASITDQINTLIEAEKAEGAEYPRAQAYKNYLEALKAVKTKKDILELTAEVDAFLAKGDHYTLQDNPTADAVREDLRNLLMEKRREALPPYDTSGITAFIDAYRKRHPDTLGEKSSQEAAILIQLESIRDLLEDPATVGLYEQTEFGTIKKEINSTINYIKKLAKRDSVSEFNDKTKIDQLKSVIGDALKGKAKGPKENTPDDTPQAPPYWDAEWTKLEGQDVLQVPGSKYFAIPTTGRKNAANYIASHEDTRDEIAQLTKKEVTKWLAGRAKDEGVEPSGYYEGKKESEPPTEAQIIQEAVAQVEEEFADKNKNLFENGKKEPELEPDPIFEEAAVPLEGNWKSDIMGAKTLNDIVGVVSRLFVAAVQKVKKGLTDYKDDETSDYGLKVRGKKAREEINAQVREIIERVDDPAKLTGEEIALLKQYSGKGGLTENSQYEYYTPTHVAEGLWEAMQANGFQNGNVLDPSTGHGVFSGAKPKGALMTGCDVDPVGSKVAALLNPEDQIENKPFEQLVMETPDESFDGVITNVPFGDARGACAHDDPAYKDEKRIERYFILRALDKIKPGKLACFVTPPNIVGAKGGKWETFRTAVSKKAEFLGAHKLPSKTFAAQGTDTVVDVVVFKKHSKDLLEKIDSLHTDTLRETKVLWEEFISGEYWKGEGRKFIMGKWMPKVEGDRWSRETVDGDIDNEAMKRKLALKFKSRIDWDALEAAEPVVKNYADGDRRVINGDEYEMTSGEWVKVRKTESTDDMVLEAAKYGAKSYGELQGILSSPRGALQLTADQAFAVWKAYPDLMTPLQKNSIEFAMSQPKDEYREQIWRGSIIGGMIGRLSNAMNDDTPGDNDPSAMQAELQDLITSEIEKYGHPKNNKGLMITGENSKTFGLFVNAMDETGNFSDLISGNMNADTLQFDSTNVQSIVSYLYTREGITSIELEDVQRLYGGTRKIESLGDLAEDDGIAITPDGMIMPLGRYCSGDIYPKLQAMTKAMENEPDERIKAKYQKQIDKIMKRRKVTPPENIQFGLQQKWFSRKYIVDFLKENGYPRIDYGVLRDVEKEDPVTGEKTTEPDWVKDYENPFGEFIGYMEDTGWLKQFNKFLNGKNVTSSKKEIKEEYQKQVNALQDQFNVWMQQHPDIDQITEKYNQKFNGHLPFEYGGEDLKLEGGSPQVKLHDFQSAAIQRLSEEGRGVLAFDVGLGKTYSAMGLYAYNKQMGRSKKTCVVVPNAVLGNWYHSSKKFLGNHDGVLTIGFKPKMDKDGSIKREVVKDEEGNPKKNKLTGELEYRDALIRADSKEDVWEDMWKVVQGNHSLVIMTKEKFGTIPMRPKTKRGYADKMTERALISDKQAEKAVTENSYGAENAVSYQQDKDRLNLEQKYADEGTRKKGELPYFEDMGFTDVIVDECHDYKNSYTAGEQTKNIAYLPTAPSAKRALDMAMKMNCLRDQNNGRGPYLLSATPVTNSPFEIYNILSLVCPMEEFERFGVYTVDDFVRVFGQIEQVDKVKVSGEISSMDGLTGFQNLDGLRNLFHKYTNMKNAKDVNLPLPPHDETHDMVELTEEQMTVYGTLRERAKEAAKPGAGESMFAVMRDMDRVTTDMDLYNHTMTFHFKASDKAKVDTIVEKMPKSITTTIQEDGESVKAEIDFFQESRIEGNTYVLVVPEAYEELIVAKFPEAGVEETEVGHPVTPKYAKLIERLREHFEAKGKQLIFTEEKSQHEKIKRLVINQVPVWKDVIAVINAETASGTNLKKIENAYNSGKYKIIVANKKAEVGVNLQKGTTAIHHLTLPWTPASIQQRNGRGVRQGNKAEHVAIYYYLGKGSFDQYRLDLLQKKSNWMRELFTGEDATAENANAFQADEYVDMLEDDPEEAKKRRMERLAKKAAERKAREDMVSVNTLQVLANNTHVLKNLDTSKQTEREKLEEKIPDLEDKLGRYESRITEEEDAEQKAFLRDKASQTKKQLDNAKTRLENLDKSYEEKRTNLEAKIKQNSGLLKHRAEKTGIPFDESLIDHPENAVVSLDGVVVTKGDYYEVTEGEDRFQERYAGVVLEITEVNPEGKWLKFEGVLDARYINLPNQYVTDPATGESDAVTLIKDWPSKFMKKVSYSKAEMDLKKMLAKDIRHYEEIMEFDKQVFLDHVNELELSEWTECLMRIPGKGLVYDRLGENSRDTLVYPEPQDENFRKEMCELYLRMDRAAEAGYDIENFMEELFGDQWHEIAMQYGKTATESEIREAAATVLKNTKESILSNHDIEEYQSLEYALHRNQRDLAHAIAQNVDGDNAEDIDRIASECIEFAKIEVERELDRLKREATEKEKEELKKHPDYKEVPAEVDRAFREIGITVKTNTTKMVAPGFKGRKGTPHEPFTRWFFQDDNGKRGKLFKMKEIFKSRYSAKFFCDADDVFQGAWWHVPATVDLKEVYELLA